MTRLVAAVVAVTVFVGACGEAVPASPVELAERHIALHNAGDVGGFLAAFGEGMVVAEIGTSRDPAVAEALSFHVATLEGADGFVASCEPWGSDGAQCEGFVYDRVFSPAGLTRHLTLAYQFDEEGKIVRLGKNDVYDQVELGRFSLEFTAWVTEAHPDLAPMVTAYGHIVKGTGGAEAASTLIPLAEEFIAVSDTWPIER